jgi:hypothetical protein
MFTECRISAVRTAGGALAAIALAAALVAAVGCAGNSRWTASREDDRYLYVPGVATGASSLEEGKRRAVLQAVSEIVQFFGYTSTVEYNEKRTELSTKILDQFTAASGDARVRGSMVEDLRWERDPGKGTYDVYVIVRFPKEEIHRERTRLLREEAERHWLVQKCLRDGAAAEGQGDVRTALAQYVQALRLCAGDPAFGNARAQAASALGSLAGRLRLEEVSGNNQRAELYGDLTGPLVVRATLPGVQGGVAARGLPVVFEAVDTLAEIAQAGATDEKGIASARVERIRSMSATNRVRASLDMDRLLSQPSDLSQNDTATVASAVAVLRKQAVDFSFGSFVERPVKVAVRIREENLDLAVEDSILAHELSRLLLGAGFQIATDPERAVSGLWEAGGDAAVAGDAVADVDAAAVVGLAAGAEADFVIRGRASTRRAGPGFSGMVCCFSDVSVEVVSPKDGKVVVRKQEIGVKGFGLTEGEAGLQALRKAAAAAAGPIVEGMRHAVIRREPREGEVP